MARRGDRLAARKVLGAREGPGDKERSQGSQPASARSSPSVWFEGAAGALVGCSDSAKGKEVTTFSLGLRT